MTSTIQEQAIELASDAWQSVKYIPSRIIRQTFDLSEKMPHYEDFSAAELFHKILIRLHNMHHRIDYCECPCGESQCTKASRNPAVPHLNANALAEKRKTHHQVLKYLLSILVQRDANLFSRRIISLNDASNMRITDDPLTTMLNYSPMMAIVSLEMYPHGFHHRQYDNAIMTAVNPSKNVSSAFLFALVTVCLDRRLTHCVQKSWTSLLETLRRHANPSATNEAEISYYGLLLEFYSVMKQFAFPDKSGILIEFGQLTRPINKTISNSLSKLYLQQFYYSEIVVSLFKPLCIISDLSNIIVRYTNMNVQK